MSIRELGYMHSGPRRMARRWPSDQVYRRCWYRWRTLHGANGQCPSRGEGIGFRWSDHRDCVWVLHGLCMDSQKPDITARPLPDHGVEPNCRHRPPQRTHCEPTGAPPGSAAPTCTGLHQPAQTAKACLMSGGAACRKHAGDRRWTGSPTDQTDPTALNPGGLSR